MTSSIPSIHDWPRAFARRNRLTNVTTTHSNDYHRRQLQRPAMTSCNAITGRGDRRAFTCCCVQLFCPGNESLLPVTILNARLSSCKTTEVTGISIKTHLPEAPATIHDHRHDHRPEHWNQYPKFWILAVVSFSFDSKRSFDADLYYP